MVKYKDFIYHEDDKKISVSIIIGDKLYGNSIDKLKSNNLGYSIKCLSIGVLNTIDKFKKETGKDLKLIEDGKYILV